MKLSSLFGLSNSHQGGKARDMDTLVLLWISFIQYESLTEKLRREFERFCWHSSCGICRIPVGSIHCGGSHGGTRLILIRGGNRRSCSKRTRHSPCCNNPSCVERNRQPCRCFRTKRTWSFVCTTNQRRILRRCHMAFLQLEQLEEKKNVNSLEHEEDFLRSL